MTHVTCRLTAKNRDQLWNPTLSDRVRATFTFTTDVWCSGLCVCMLRRSVSSSGHCEGGESETKVGELGVGSVHWELDGSQRHLPEHRAISQATQVSHQSAVVSLCLSVYLSPCLSLCLSLSLSVCLSSVSSLHWERDGGVSHVPVHCLTCQADWASGYRSQCGLLLQT